MRSIMGYAAAAVAMMMVGTVPAQAAWKCDGPAYVCGSAKSQASKANYKVSYQAAPKATYKTSNKTRKAKRYSNNVAYSSGGTTYSGKASYYWQPQRVASGGWFNPNAMTAAHKTLPFGTKVRVTNKNNGRSVVVTINDRGPYIKGRIIDLSKAAAHSISMQGSGVVPVSVTVIGRG